MNATRKPRVATEIVYQKAYWLTGLTVTRQTTCSLCNDCYCAVTNNSKASQRVHKGGQVGADPAVSRAMQGAARLRDQLLVGGRVGNRIAFYSSDLRRGMGLWNVEKERSLRPGVPDNLCSQHASHFQLKI